MSLIRYSSDDSRSVVLRHQQTLVLYDPHSRQIILREASPATPVDATNSQSCPYCKRPMHHGDEPTSDPLSPGLGGHRARSSTPLADSGFVDQHYFRMLDSSIPVVDSTSPETRRSVPLPRLTPETNQSSSDEAASEDDAPNSQRDGGIKDSSFSPGYFERFFVTERELGRGGKGVVLLVRHVLDSVTLGNFACKRVPVGNNHGWLEKVLMEVQLLQRLSHANLVSYRHVWLENAQISAFGPSVPCAFILQQYCNSGDLHHFILGSPKPPTKESLKERLRRKSRGQPEPPGQLFNIRKMPFKQIISFFRDIAQGLNHLHSNGFIHRDLKPSNCLLHDTGIPGEELKVLVSDFGEVQMENQVRESTGNTGTISYCAPEVLKRVAPGGAYENFTTKSDIFSLGMILHFMSFGKLPYICADQINEENEDMEALRAEISAWKGLDEHEMIRTDLPEQLYHSLKALINPDPTVRPSAEEILLGIELGVSEEAPPMRRGSVAHNSPPVIDESQTLGFKRISPIADTPRSITPDPLGPRSLKEPPSFTSNGHTLGDKRNGSSRGPRNSKLSWSATPPGSPKRPSGSPKQPKLQKENTIAPEDPVTGSSMTESSMILRPHLDSPKPIEPLLDFEVVPPTGSGWRGKLLAPQSIILVKIVVFFMKMLSLTRPCIPAAPNSSVHYPMIMFAILDFIAPSLTLTTTLGIAHIGLLMLVNTFGELCMY